jgi:hypothetical protein
MLSEYAIAVIEQVRSAGRAYFKPITSTDVKGASNQYGFYIHRGAAPLFTAQAPRPGVNMSTDLDIDWVDGTTESSFKWYGSKGEYRITRFGQGFRWREPELLGSLLVLIPSGPDRFSAHILESDDDVDGLLAELNLDLTPGFALYPPTESISECLETRFSRYTRGLQGRNFPATAVIAQQTLDALLDCDDVFEMRSADARLLHLVEAEYSLFQKVEEHLLHADLIRPFAGIQDFLQKAQTVLQRRKSRAGASLEKHVEHVLQAAGIRFDRQASIEGGKKPDLLLPGKREYEDDAFPAERILLVGVKRTCRDRWRQVLNEGDRAEKKYILTLQQGISVTQLDEMAAHHVTLIVPRELHSAYPAAYRGRLLSVDAFIDRARALQNI